MMSKQRKQWGPASPRMAHSNSSGNAQWGAAVTLRALQSEAVPIRGPSTYQKQGLTPSQLSAYTQRRPSRSRSDQPVYQRPPSSTSGSWSSGSNNNNDNTITPPEHLSNSQRPSDATIRQGRTSTLGVYQPGPASQNNMSLGLKPSPMSLRTQSALGIYRPAEDISPRQLTFDGAAYFTHQATASNAYPSHQYYDDIAQQSSASVSRYQHLPSAQEAAVRQQQSYASSQQVLQLSPPLASPLVSDSTESPPNSAKSQSTSSQKSPYERYQPLHMQSSPESEPLPAMSAEQINQHVRSRSMAQATCNAETRHASVISINPADGSTKNVSNRQRSQTDSATTRQRTDEFMRQYGLHINDEQPSQIKGGWDEDSDDEREMLSPGSSAGRSRKVTINDTVSSSPASSTKSGRTGSLFKKAFYKSGTTKRATTARRSSVSRKPVPSSSPRSILRTRPPSLTLGSPRFSNASIGSHVSPSTPGSFYCPDSAAVMNASRQSQAYEQMMKQQKQAQRASIAQSAPPVPPRRRGSVSGKSEMDAEKIPKEKDSKTEPIIATKAILTPPIVQSAPISPAVDTSPSTVNSRLSIDGNNGKNEDSATDDASSVKSVALLSVQKLDLRRPSDADSIGSSYDQESWDGGSRRGSTNTLSAPIVLNAPILRNSYFRKPSLVAEQSPLLADKVLEEDEEERLAEDGDDEGNEGESFQDAQQERCNVPTRYKIVRTNVDDSRELEYLDSIHVYDQTRDNAQERANDDAESQISSSADLLGEVEQDDEVVEMQAKPITSTQQAHRDAQEQYETLEVNRFLADYGKHVQSVRTSGFFDSSALTAHSWPSREDWTDRRTGKVNTAGFVASTVISTFTYLSPVHFRDIHAVESDKSSKCADELDALFHMDALKSSAERLFLSALPMYEHVFVNARHVWRWDSKLRSLICCLAYFTLWFRGLLLTAILATTILTIIGNQSKRNVGARLRMLSEHRQRARAVRQIHTNEWHEIVREAQKRKDVSPELIEAADALRKYGLALTIVSTRLADAHERIRNMALWARTPATVRTLVVLGLTMLFAMTATPRVLVRIPGLIFGVVFFVLAPLVERRWSLATALWLDPVEVLLAGVPNDGQNATLIMRRRMVKETERDAESETRRSSVSENAFIDASSDLIDEDVTLPSRHTFFAASHEGRGGTLSVSHDRLIFRSQSAKSPMQLRRRSSAIRSQVPTQDILLDVLLERIVRIDKITVHPSDSKSTFGLRLSVRQTGNTIGVHTLTDMDARDQAFNCIMALAPQRWQKQRPNFI